MLDDMVQGTLTQESDSDTGLRTPEVKGHFRYLPEVGHGQQFFAEPLDPRGSIRVIWTSPIVEIVTTEPGKCTFRTENTLYTLKWNVN